MGAARVRNAGVARQRQSYALVGQPLSPEAARFAEDQGERDPETLGIDARTRAAGCSGSSALRPSRPGLIYTGVGTVGEGHISDAGHEITRM